MNIAGDRVDTVETMISKDFRLLQKQLDELPESLGSC